MCCGVRASVAWFGRGVGRLCGFVSEFHLSLDRIQYIFLYGKDLCGCACVDSGLCAEAETEI